MMEKNLSEEQEMALIKGLGMVGAEAKDLARWEPFASHCMGMMVSPHRRDGLSMRIDERAQRVWVSEGPLDDMTFLGWEVEGPKEVDAMADHFGKRNVDIVWGTDREIADRGVERFFKFKDPSGNPHEIFCGAEISFIPFKSPTLRGNFITGEQGMGHVVIIQRDLNEADKFFRDLGFGVSDYVSEDGGNVVANLAFMHINKRHHSIGLAPAPTMRRRLDHIMIQVDNMDDVGLAFDRMIDSNMLIQETLGRHPNDRMFSFYARTPSGWKMEMGWDALTVTPGTWETKFYDQMSAWGHRHTDYTTRFDG
jgi:2,3-dihydroxybiphenyl 1,2-dioxygenase